MHVTGIILGVFVQIPFCFLISKNFAGMPIPPVALPNSATTLLAKLPARTSASALSVRGFLESFWANVLHANSRLPRDASALTSTP